MLEDVFRVVGLIVSFDHWVIVGNGAERIRGAFSERKTTIRGKTRFSKFRELLEIVGIEMGGISGQNILLGFDQYVTVLTNDKGHNKIDRAVITVMTAGVTQRSQRN